MHGAPEPAGRAARHHAAEDPATAELSARVDPATVAAAHPGCLAAWAALADLALAKGETVMRLRLRADRLSPRP